MRLPPQPPKTCSRVTPWTIEGLDETDGADGAEEAEGAADAVTSMGGFRTGAPAANASTGFASTVAADMRTKSRRRMAASQGVTKQIIVASTAPFNGSARPPASSTFLTALEELCLSDSRPRSCDRHRPSQYLSAVLVARVVHRSGVARQSARRLGCRCTLPLIGPGSP
jgi:hypothetical protein